MNESNIIPDVYAFVIRHLKELKKAGYVACRYLICLIHSKTNENCGLL